MTATTDTRDYAPEWLAWIANNLIRGAQPDEITQNMIAAGISRAWRSVRSPRRNSTRTSRARVRRGRSCRRSRVLLG